MSASADGIARALMELIYEVTHLSMPPKPIRELSGKAYYDCYVRQETIEAARAAIAAYEATASPPHESNRK